MTNWKLIQQVSEEQQAGEPPVPDWYLKPLPSLDPRLAVIRLDPWHVMKKIRLATGLTQIPPDWKSLIYGHPDALIFKLQGFKLQRTAPRSEFRQKMEDLIAYLKNNFDFATAL